EVGTQILSKVRRFPESARRIGRSQYGYASKLRATLGLKEGREADAIVVVVDRDGKKNKDKIGELNKGREELLHGARGPGRQGRLAQGGARSRQTDPQAAVPPGDLPTCPV